MLWRPMHDSGGEAGGKIAIQMLLPILSVEVHICGKPNRPHVNEEYSVVHNRCFSGGVLPSTSGVQRQRVRRVSRSAPVDWNFARAH